MTREQYDELSAPLVRTLLDMEDDILREIAAQLAKDGKVSDTSKWRIRQLARSGRFDKRAAAIIDGYSGVQNGQALDMILEAAKTEIGYLDNAVQAANAAGLSEYFSDIPAETSALNAAKAFQRQAASDLNLVNTVMKYKAGSAFVSAINSVYRESQKSRQDVLDVMGKSSAKFVMGHMSLQEATRKTIRELARKGIPAFTDKLGREWSPEAYIMMDMRSTLANTARAAQDMRCDQYGIKLIEVSSHMGARPLCAPYQGRIFSRDGSKGITMDGAGGKIYYTPLSETSYGQPAGLFGINCGHVQYPFAPGINFQRYFPYPKEENDRRYQQLQRQRAMERDIRATKRECMMLQETGDTEGLQKASQRLRAQKQKYSQYSKDCGLGTHYDRTQVYGYDRSKSAKTVWAERKAQSAKNGGNSLGGSASTGSGGQAVTVNIPGGSNGGSGKVYRNEGLTKGGGSGNISSDNNFNNPITSIFDKIKSFFDKSQPQNAIENSEIEEALKSLGFKSVDNSFFRLVDRNMQLSIADQIFTLENRFNAVHRSIDPYISADEKRHVACVRHRIDQPNYQSLHLSKTEFKNRNRHISNRNNDVNTFHCMPCNTDNETLSRYVVTHEYGHMVENVLISEEMKGKLGSHSDFARYYRSEITEIAKLLDRDYDESKYLSKYGSTKDTEFFAECFANSQLGQPNVLGYAMQIWLERKGL